MSVDFTFQLFTRKQMLFMIWQVFWLSFNWTPSRWWTIVLSTVVWRFSKSMVNSQWSKNSPFTTHHSPPYSYGDSVRFWL